MNWQPIETAPLDGSGILLWSIELDEPTIGRWSIGHEHLRQWWVDAWAPPAFDSPTHWMPLPAPPDAAQPVQPAAPDGSVHALVRFADVEHVYHEREELAMMIRMLTSSLKRYTPHAPQPGDLPSRAVELLRKYGLMGSPLRDECDDRVPQQAA